MLILQRHLNTDPPVVITVPPSAEPTTIVVHLTNVYSTMGMRADGTWGKSGNAKIGFDAPPEVRIMRGELLAKETT